MFVFAKMVVIWRTLDVFAKHVSNSLLNICTIWLCWFKDSLF